MYDEDEIAQFERSVRMRRFDAMPAKDRHEICYSVWYSDGVPSNFPTDPTLAEFLSLRASSKRRR